MQRIRSPGVTGVQDWKSEVHKTKGVRVGDSDGDGEWCGRWWMVQGMSGSNSL